MEVSLSVSSPKTPAKRGRSAPVAATKAAAPVAAKKATVRKTKKPAKPSQAEITSMIAVTAYYIAASRGFSPGSEMDDWLQAEREVLARYK